MLVKKLFCVLKARSFRIYTLVRRALLKKLLGPRVTAILVDSDLGPFLVGPFDSYVGRSLQRPGGYSGRELNLLRKLVDETSRVVFVGAHVGALGLPMADIVSEVILIEANPDTFDLLSKNVAIRGLSNVSLHNVAVGENRGAISFLSNEINSGGSKREPSKIIADYYYDVADRFTVPLERLDHLLDDRPIKLLVMDIEGSEYFALKGMERLFGKVEILAVEFVHHHINNVANVTLEAFVSPLINHFDYCLVPELSVIFHKHEVYEFLAKAMLEDVAMDTIIFSRSKKSLAGVVSNE